MVNVHISLIDDHASHTVQLNDGLSLCWARQALGFFVKLKDKTLTQLYDNIYSLKDHFENFTKPKEVTFPKIISDSHLQEETNFIFLLRISYKIKNFESSLVVEHFNHYKFKVLPQMLEGCPSTESGS